MTVLAQAKVNLTLEVFGVRPDGYHALRSVVLPVSLADELDVETVRQDGVKSDLGLPGDLSVKAAKAFLAATGRRTGVRIRVVKRIPAGGGLGGGSADAAAVLRAMDQILGTRLGVERLAEIGATVGSDVPALVLAQSLGRSVIMEGRGETVRPVETAPGRLNLVLANPGVHSSTPEVFARSVPRDPGNGAVLREMLAALASGEVERLAAALVNDLEPAATALHPEIGEALSAVREAGAVGARMSGSGATVFGFARSGAEAERIACSLRERGLSAWACRDSE